MDCQRCLSQAENIDSINNKKRKKSGKEHERKENSDASIARYKRGLTRNVPSRRFIIITDVLYYNYRGIMKKKEETRSIRDCNLRENFLVAWKTSELSLL